MANEHRIDGSSAMTTVFLSNERNIAPSDFATIVKAVQMRVSDFATKWNLGTVTLTQDATIKCDMKIRVTDRFRHTGAKGYHGVDANGIPTAFCSPNASINKLFGTYRKAIMSRGKVLYPAKLTSGLTDIIQHEAVEMLADPLIKTLSTPDANSHCWLVEPADPVDGVFDMQVVDGKQVIFCDFVFPNFYQLGSTGPWDFSGAVKAPFTIPVKTGYGFWKNLKGLFVKV